MEKTKESVQRLQPAYSLEPFRQAKPEGNKICVLKVQTGNDKLKSQFRDVRGYLLLLVCLAPPIVGLWKSKYAWHRYSCVVCIIFRMSAYSAIISIFFKKKMNHGTLWWFMSVWVCSQHTRKGVCVCVGGGGGERKVCSFSWLQASAENFPSSPPLPAPTSCLHYSRVFQATPVTVRSGRSLKPTGGTVLAFLPVLPRGCWPLVRSAARSLTVLCAVPVVKKRGGVGLAGIAPWEALGRREAKASFEKRSTVAAMNRWALNWAELRCRLAASWRWEEPGITKSTASLVISVN